MISSELNRLLSGASGVSSFPGASEEDLRSVSLSGARFPDSHLEFLRVSNGMLVYGGYFRLLPLSHGHQYSVQSWNEPELWKFAWPSECLEYIAFGETALGDQYAYKLSEAISESNPSVYLLDAYTMMAEMIGDNFDDFLKTEFFRCAVAPYDHIIRAARDRLGDLGFESHVAYVPSLLLGGEEDSNNLHKMAAIQSMIANGDLYTQLRGHTFERAVDRLETYRDPLGRPRIRVVWDSHC